MVFDIKKRETLRKRLEGYLNEYREFYSEYALDEIEENFLNPYRPIRDSSDVLNQIYAYLGIFDVEKDNAYDIFIKLIKSRMNIHRNLLEVGCGYYPSLALRMLRHQKRGSITAIDPLLVKEDFEGIKVIKTRLSKNFDITPYDMLYGLYPCDATLDMIELASDYDKDLCILACDCYETLDGELDDMNEWIKYIKEYIMSCNPKGRVYKIEKIKSLKAPLITMRKSTK